MEQIDALLIPISPTTPVGSPSAIRPSSIGWSARAGEDDESLPTGVWQSTPRRADWEEVARLASHLTTSRSKDLVVMSRLGDARIRLHGLPALPQALALLTRALEQYPEALHPQIREGIMIIAPHRSVGWRSITPCWLPIPRCLRSTVKASHSASGSRVIIPAHRSARPVAL